MFNCLQCGICCKKPSQESNDAKDEIIKKIPVYPEEADILEVLARKNNIPLRLIEDNILPDVKNKKIIVTRFNIILDEQNNFTCPFSINNKCSIYDNRPLVCRAYPVSLKEVDAFRREIFLDKNCLGIQKLEKGLENIDLEGLKKMFPLEFNFALQLFNREKQIILKLKSLEMDQKIELGVKISFEEFDNAIKNWDRTILYTQID
ncbi:MAG: YkgJ family cysteine cluster protein [Promethearchaeota archaeon]